MSQGYYPQQNYAYSDSAPTYASPSQGGHAHSLSDPFAGQGGPQQQPYSAVPLSHDPEMQDLSTRPLSGGEVGGASAYWEGPSARNSAGGSAFDAPDWEGEYGSGIPWYKRKKALLAAAGVLLVALAVALGVGLGVGLGSKKNNSTDEAARLSSIASASEASRTASVGYSLYTSTMTNSVGSVTEVVSTDTSAPAAQSTTTTEPAPTSSSTSQTTEAPPASSSSSMTPDPTSSSTTESSSETTPPPSSTTESSSSPSSSQTATPPPSSSSTTTDAPTSTTPESSSSSTTTPAGDTTSAAESTTSAATTSAPGESSSATPTEGNAAATPAQSTDSNGGSYVFTTRPIVNPGGFTIGTLTGYVTVTGA